MRDAWPRATSGRGGSGELKLPGGQSGAGAETVRGESTCCPTSRAGCRGGQRPCEVANGRGRPGEGRQRASRMLIRMAQYSGGECECAHFWRLQEPAPTGRCPAAGDSGGRYSGLIVGVGVAGSATRADPTKR